MRDREVEKFIEHHFYSCTIDAIVAIKQMRLKKLRSTFAKFGLIQASAPGLKDNY